MTWYDQGYEVAGELDALGKARIDAHEAFDRIWEDAPVRYWARRVCYAWLAAQLGLSAREAHMARMDAERCARVVETCEGVQWEDVARWWSLRQRGRPRDSG